MERLHRQPLGREVTRLLRRMIVEGEIKPGERLVEDRLSHILGASRTPLREALHRLEQEGLLSKREGGGYELPLLSAEEVEEAVETRALLESYAASLAARRAAPQTLADMERSVEDFRQALERGDHRELVAQNARFHGLIGQAAASRLLSRLMQELEGLVERLSAGPAEGREPGDWSVAEHEQILAALRARDPEAAALAAGEHVRRGGRWILSRLGRDSSATTKDKEDACSNVSRP